MEIKLQVNILSAIAQRTCGFKTPNRVEWVKFFINYCENNPSHDFFSHSENQKLFQEWKKENSINK